MQKFAYNSLSGLGISTRDNTSRDSMISLSTKDGSMNSHRWGFTDLGCEDGWMVSEHVPFSNDTETLIRTWMKPLGNFHIRVHRVTLSREYSVSEGGFSIGIWDDYRESKSTEHGFQVSSNELESSISTVSNVSFKYTEMRPQPGMHLLAPFAVYPAYRTDVLEAGTYIFASVFKINKAGKGEELPTISLHGDGEVFLNGKRLL